MGHTGGDPNRDLRLGDELAQKGSRMVSYRDYYERLAAIQHTYDPTKFFRVNQNIKPSL